MVAVNQGQATGLILRIECGHEFLQPLIAHRRADFDADRVGYAAEIFDVRTFDLRRAHTDPRHMGG